MKSILCLRFSLCASALRLPIEPTQSAPDTNFPTELTRSFDNHAGDVILSKESIENLSKIYPDWDEPLPLLAPHHHHHHHHHHHLPGFDTRESVTWKIEYDKSTMCRMSMYDKIIFFQNERVMLVSPEDFNSLVFMHKLPSSGAVIFVSDHPTHSTCRSVQCKNASFLDDPRILAVAAENSKCKHPKMGFLPIGVESKTQLGMRGSEVLQTLTQWTHNPLPASQRKNNVQSDAHLRIFDRPFSGDRNDRKDMKNQVQISAIDDWYHSHVDFISHIKNHVSQAKLALCPEGNGIDTHRFYHNYGLRTRCIVRKGVLTELHKQFPGTVVVNDWHEVNAGNITKWIEEGPATYDPKLLTSDYWINKFLKPHGISLQV